MSVASAPRGAKKLTDQHQEATDDAERLVEAADSVGTCESRDGLVFEEVALRVRRVDGPPVVDDDIEEREEQDEEEGRRLGLEADGDHRARAEAEQRDDRSQQCWSVRWLESMAQTH